MSRWTASRGGIAWAWLLLAMLLAGWPGHVLAQSVGVDATRGVRIPTLAPPGPPPGAPPPGSPLRAIAPPGGPAGGPLAPPVPPALLPPSDLPTASVVISAVSIEGATAYPAADLLALVRRHIDVKNRTGNLSYPRSTVSLGAIESARRDLLLKYRNDGYPFIVVAARVDSGGQLRFLITEGFIAEVKLSGDRAQIGPVARLVQAFLNHLTKRRPINNASIERWLLLAQTIPGVQIQPIVQASDREPGAFTLIAKLTRTPYGGSVAVDNRAFQSTGTGEAMLTLGLNSLTALGERSEGSFFVAGPSGRQVFGQYNESFFLGNSGLSVRLYAGAGDTLPCCDLAAIGYDGKTVVFGMELSYPLLLSRDQRLYGGLMFDALDTEALENTGRASADSLRILRGQLDDRLSDTLLGDSMPADSSIAVRISQGLGILGTSANGRSDGGRLNQNLQFFKVNGEATREQTLAQVAGGPRVSLFGLATGQLTGDVLPSAEEFYLGGLRYTRGFYSGEVSGDRALAATLELRLSWEFAADAFGAATTIKPQLYGFYDWGQTWQNQTTDQGHRLHSFGVGLRTELTPNLRADLEAVQRITRAVGGAAARPDAVNAVYARVVTQF